MIKKFAITGGPCSGKTTALVRLVEYLQRERGFRVFVCEEAATLGWKSGVAPSDLSYPDCEEGFLQFVLNLQFCLEDNFVKYAKAIGQNCIILCDRGLMDGSAYVTPKQWENVISRNKVPIITTSAVKDGTEKIKMVPLTAISDWDVLRYDAVFHLVTAADGAPKYYTLENNLGARHETLEMAIEQDMKTQIAWSDHPHHIIIDNKGKTFEQKIEALIDLISNYL